MSTPQTPAFDFGKNWEDFSREALDPGRVAQASADFHALLAGIELRDRAFLDIGFGQALGLLNAASSGARAVGCDINPKCARLVEKNRHFFPAARDIPVVVGSILDAEVVSRLRAANGGRPFEIVHSWGVLHHTGDMTKAIAHAASLVAPGGHFILAIYNRHWSSRTWKVIKHLYVLSPRLLQRLFIALFYPVIYGAKWIATGRNPHTQDRGMDFYYDVVDWVGGYPYEYASADETIRELAGLGFRCVRQIPAGVPTGCNQFVFVRQS